MKVLQTMSSFGLKAALCAGLLSLVSVASAADEWGTIKGKFVLDGKATEPKPITVTKDPEFCGKHNLVEEELVVGADGGIKNVVMYLYTTRRDKKPDVHPDLKKADKATMDNANCRFEPRVIAVTTGQTLELGNKDPVGHNMNVTTLQTGNPALNVLIPAMKSVDHKFNEEETLPVTVVCNIHPWMKGYVVVKDHPYVAITDAEGNFEIKNVPVGKWKFKAWQEKAGYVTKVTVDGKKTEWKRGEVQLTIKPGATLDLGEIKVDPSIFKK